MAVHSLSIGFINPYNLSQVLNSGIGLNAVIIIIIIKVSVQEAFKRYICFL